MPPTATDVNKDPQTQNVSAGERRCKISAMQRLMRLTLCANAFDSITVMEHGVAPKKGKTGKLINMYCFSCKRILLVQASHTLVLFVFLLLHITITIGQLMDT